MEDFKIAVIGGPKGGKSDFMSVIKRNLHNKKEEGKYKCIIVPETAREVLKNIMAFDEVEREFFQNCIFNRQVFKEKEAETAKQAFKDKQIVTICDRGIMDNKAYLDDDEYFRYMVKNAGTSEIEILDSYNLVLYLVSSAKLDNDTYEDGQDDVREENKKLAYELDEKTIKAWLGHRNIVIIKPEEDFNVKLSKAVLTVKKQLKYGREAKEQYDITNYDTSAYETGEFPTIQETTYRFPKFIMSRYLKGVIKRTYNGDSSYIKFTKYDDEIDNYYVTKSEEQISLKEFKKLIKENGVYPAPTTQEITYVYEDNTIYKIIKDGEKKYYEIMSGEKKPPKLLIKKDKENTQPKIKTKDFKNN